MKNRARDPCRGGNSPTPKKLNIDTADIAMTIAMLYIYILYILYVCMYVCMYVNNVNMYLYIFCSAKSNTEGDPSLPYPCPF